MKPTLSNQIKVANNMLKRSKVSPLEWPSYNRGGHCFNRIARILTALQLQDPIDVPCWSFWLEDYIPGAQFWEAWESIMNEQGEPARELEDLMDDALNGPLTESYKVGTVLGQVAALSRMRQV